MISWIKRIVGKRVEMNSRNKNISLKIDTGEHEKIILISKNTLYTQIRRYQVRISETLNENTKYYIFLKRQTILNILVNKSFNDFKWFGNLVP